MSNRLSDQERIDVVAKYIAGKSPIELSKIYGVTDTAILGILKRRGVVRRKAIKFNK